MSIHTIDRRALLGWIARTSAGVAGLSLFGCNRADVRGETDAGIDPDASDAARTCAPTTSDVLGPYYRTGAPSRMTIASPTEPGERLRIEGVVIGPDCTPLAGAMCDIWQADRNGTYYEPNAGEPYRLRGKLMSATDGTWQLETIRPGNYMLGAASWRPAHIHITVSHPAFRSVTTQIYFEGDPYLPPNDGCTNCGSDDPARIIRLFPAAMGSRAELSLVLARA